ncbi:DUF167 domain-containing protein [Falsiruegeria litorea]|uniref:DUF167 domain-containing protein n=1 Tax=Falsiruegeria litorea TaxID=1280831 RepID=UPI000A26C084|nr:DUF167 domain-containing protein [Falsiruegeria litorea]
MARAKVKNLLDLSEHARPGQEITVKVTPNAAQTSLMLKGEVLHASVTAPPENGKANAAVARLLAQALGIAPSGLSLMRGQTSRHKTFRVVSF